MLATNLNKRHLPPGTLTDCYAGVSAQEKLKNFFLKSINLNPQNTFDSTPNTDIYILPRISIHSFNTAKILPAEEGGTEASPEGLLLGEDRVLAPLRGRCALGDMREGPIFFFFKTRKKRGRVLAITLPPTHDPSKTHLSSFNYPSHFLTVSPSRPPTKIYFITHLH